MGSVTTSRTPAATGDPPWAAHVNRIYARVHNFGDAAASALTVNFYVSQPARIGDNGSWELIGTLTRFGPVQPRSFRDGFAEWTPTSDEPASIKVVIDPVAGETMTANNMVIEGSAFVAADFFTLPEFDFLFHNPSEDSSVDLSFQAVVSPQSQAAQGLAEAAGAADWSAQVTGFPARLRAGGDCLVQASLVPPNPCTVSDGSPAMISIVGSYKLSGMNHPPNPIEGPTLFVRSTKLAAIDLNCPSQSVSVGTSASFRGQLFEQDCVQFGFKSLSASNQPVVLEYLSPSGKTVMRSVKTGTGGAVADSFAPDEVGDWTVQASWIGNTTHPFTSSAPCSFTAVEGPSSSISLFVSSFGTNDVKRYNGTSGAFIATFATGGGLGMPVGLAFGPDGNLYVSSPASNNVVRYNGTTGAFMGVFASGGGLMNPQGITFGPDRNLYVASFNTNSILKYRGTTGTFMGVFSDLTTRAGTNCGPEGLVFGIDGSLYVSCSLSSSIVRLNGASGAFISFFVASGAGGLSNPQGLTFGREGNLYVSSFNTNQVLRYDGGTGASLGVFASGGGLLNPNGLTFGPDRNLYVSSFGTSTVKRYRGTTGAYLGDFASGGGLKQPTFLVFK